MNNHEAVTDDVIRQDIVAALGDVESDKKIQLYYKFSTGAGATVVGVVIGDVNEDRVAQLRDALVASASRATFGTPR
jgi:hypothetical protein